MATNPERDPDREEFEAVLAANPGLREHIDALVDQYLRGELVLVDHALCTRPRGEAILAANPGLREKLEKKLRLATEGKLDTVDSSGIDAALAEALGRPLEGD